MYKKHILFNGLRIVTEYIPYVNSVSVGIWVGNGSRNEQPHNSGISHFIEHMMFKGTENRSAREIAESIEELGGQINAFTGKESTCYYAKVLDSHLDIAIDVLSDMLLNSKFNEKDMEKEKGVIMEEISMYEDSPEDTVMDLLSKAMWPESSMGYPILGDVKTLKEFNRDMLRDYMNRYYTADNMVISVAGNFDEDKLLKLALEKFKPLKSTGEHIEYDRPEIKKDMVTKYKDIEQVHLSFGLKGIELGNEDLYTLLVINNIFGGGTSSGLFQKIREERGLAYSIYSYPSSYKNIGVTSIYVGLNPQYVGDVIELIKEEIDILRHKGISEEQLNKSKEQLKGNYILGLESTSNRMFGIGKSELLINRIYDPKEVLKIIDSITLEDAGKVIEDVFGRGIICGAAVGKIDEKMGLERVVS